MDYTSLLLNNQLYVLIVGAILLVSDLVKRYGVFMPFYRWLIARVKSKRLLVAMISAISGILPIPGRVAVSAGVLNTLAPSSGPGRSVYGIIDYLATHHYYFWSPLEKTVLLPMAVLGITYVGFITIIWPLLLTSLLVTCFYIFVVLKEDDIIIKLDHIDEGHTHVFDWQNYLITLGAVYVTIFLGNVVTLYEPQITTAVQSLRGLLPIALLVGFLSSFILGSSSKFAGYTALSASVFGVKFLPIFFAVDYAAYMFSPAHKCLVIGSGYFKTPLAEYFEAIGILCGSIFMVALLLTLLP